MKNLTYILFIALLYGCTKDLKNPDNFSEHLFENLVNQNTEKVKSLYLSEKDKERVVDTLLNGFFQNAITDKEFKKEYLVKQEKEIKEWYKIAIDKGITSKNSSYLRAEIDTIKSFDRNTYNLKIFFLLDKKENYFIATDIDKMKDGWTIYGIETPTTVEDEKKRIENLPYKPFGLYFTSWNWQYKYASINSFSEFFVTLSNQSGNDFERIKYRVTIYDTKNGGRTQVFSKILERNEKIYNGDVVRFEVNELRDFYVGVDVSNKNNFECNAEVVDAKPRPTNQ
ncbi:MAG: hypothetical protein WCK82_09715 [Bacteroidota bacterium]